jgi:hypothetical protein
MSVLVNLQNVAIRLFYQSGLNYLMASGNYNC